MTRAHSCPRTILAVALCMIGMLIGGARSPVSNAAGGELGGGAGIAANGTPCTLTTIGHDGSGALVGFTAASCGAPGAQITAGGASDRLGSIAATNPDMDYAVITFDPGKVTPVADIGGFPINGIGPEIGPVQRVCTHSIATRNQCGLTGSPGQDPGTILAHWCGKPADAGAPVTMNGQLVGMMHDYVVTSRCPRYVYSIDEWQVPVQARPEVVSISAIVNDLNARGGPGAGFVPIGG
jgi:hypothetical protein